MQQPCSSHAAAPLAAWGRASEQLQRMQYISPWGSRYGCQLSPGLYFLPLKSQNVSGPASEREELGEKRGWFPQ